MFHVKLRPREAKNLCRAAQPVSRIAGVGIQAAKLQSPGSQKFHFSTLMPKDLAVFLAFLLSIKRIIHPFIFEYS